MAATSYEAAACRKRGSDGFDLSKPPLGYVFSFLAAKDHLPQLRFFLFPQGSIVLLFSFLL